jgi:hypothetical protein
MSGLIGNAIGESLGRGATGIADLMFRAIQKDEDREARAQERRELQTERLAAARESREANDTLRRDLADQRAAAGGGKGGSGGISEIKEGGLIEEVLAGKTGMSVPELRALRAANQSGDFSSFATATATGRVEDVNGDGMPDDPEVSDAMSRRTAKLETDARVQPELREELRAKTKVLAGLTESFVLGKDYDDVAKGRRTELGNDTAAGVYAGKVKPEEGGKKIAAAEGKDLYGGDSNVTRDKFTGDTKTTAVGDSQIRENNAQAARAGRSSVDKDASLQTLQQLRLSADGTLKDARRALTEFDKIAKDLPAKAREARAEERKQLAQDVETARANLGDVSGLLSKRLGVEKPEKEAAPSPKAPAAPAPAAASGTPRISSQDEYARLPSGTRFIAPDGKTRIKP